MTLTPLIDDEHVISKLINDTSDLFVQLLEHQDIEVKLLASESFVIIANIIDTFGYDDMFEIDLEETLKEQRIQEEELESFRLENERVKEELMRLNEEYEQNIRFSAKEIE